MRIVFGDAFPDTLYRVDCPHRDGIMESHHRGHVRVLLNGIRDAGTTIFHTQIHLVINWFNGIALDRLLKSKHRADRWTKTRGSPRFWIGEEADFFVSEVQ